MRRFLALALSVVALGLAACEPPGGTSSAVGGSSTSSVRIGGPFQLTDAETGRPVAQADLSGRPTAMFFGFTHCPDVCPTTLASASRWLQALGRDGDRLQVVFVSVDPERDTAQTMREYLGNFDPRIRGFVGTEEQLTEMARNYRVYFRRVPLEGGGHTVDHSSMVLLFDERGEFVRPIGYGESDDRALASLRRLLAS